MSSYSFIKEKLESAIKLFPQIRLRYQFDMLANIHIVEVSPLAIFKNDLAYANFEEELIYQCIQSYPGENICFVSDDSSIKLEQFDYELKGSLFGFTSYNPLQNILVTHLTHFENQPVQPLISGSLSFSYKQELSYLYDIFISQKGLHQLPIKEIPRVQQEEDFSLIEKSNTPASSLGENNYALAA